MLTVSFGVTFWVAANQVPLRSRSFWNLSAEGTSRVMRSYMPLTVRPMGKTYCAPTFQAVSLPMSVRYGGEAIAANSGNSATIVAKVPQSRFGSQLGPVKSGGLQPEARTP